MSFPRGSLAKAEVASLDCAARPALTRLLMLLLCGTLACCVGCAAVPTLKLGAKDVPSLTLNGESYTFEQAIAANRKPEVLALTDEMRAFVEEVTGDSNNPRYNIMALHNAVKSPSGLFLQYDPFAEGDARAAFERGTANCLSYAHLFIALAREAGLNARYQWMEVRPEWQRLGERVAIRLHVNVYVKLYDGTEFMIDIDPLSRSEVAGARLMSDAEGLALYHNNLAMQALAEDRPLEAWTALVRGLAAAPRMSQLWVNLGAIYRHTGQYAEAEQAYFRALEADSGDRSAMNNLVVLYDIQGRIDEQDYWIDRMRRYRELNPYYHAQIGDQAMAAQDWERAAESYRRAYRLQPEDALIIYGLGMAEYELGHDKQAIKLIAKAIERASFNVEKQRYKMLLRTIREQQAAVL